MDGLNAIDSDRWKQHEKFKDFVESLEKLNKEEYIQQKRKLTHFLKCVFESISKYFDQLLRNTHGFLLDYYIHTVCTMVCT